MNDAHKDTTATEGAHEQPNTQYTENAADTAQQEFAEIRESLADDAGDHKGLAILGYILPILFFLPLLSEEGKKSEFARFHANQHLILLIAIFGLYILHNILFTMFFMGGFFIMQLINIAFLAFVIIGIINAAKGEMKELPLIGSFKILTK